MQTADWLLFNKQTPDTSPIMADSERVNFQFASGVIFDTTVGGTCTEGTTSYVDIATCIAALKNGGVDGFQLTTKFIETPETTDASGNAVPASQTTTLSCVTVSSTTTAPCTTTAPLQAREESQEGSTTTTIVKAVVKALLPDACTATASSVTDKIFSRELNYDDPPANKPFEQILPKKKHRLAYDNCEWALQENSATVSHQCYDAPNDDNVAYKLKKTLAIKIFGYLARCEGKFCI